jgi:ferredoxin
MTKPKGKKPKGKTPSLLSISTGTPAFHKCGKATHCGRCNSVVATGHSCFQIPKMKNGFTAHPIFCIDCTLTIIEQTKAELLDVEKAVNAHEAGTISGSVSK